MLIKKGKVDVKELEKNKMEMEQLLITERTIEMGGWGEAEG